MTNEYALDQLLRQELKWHADHNTGYYIAYTQNDARNGVLVLLKGHEDAPVKLELVLENIENILYLNQLHQSSEKHKIFH